MNSSLISADRTTHLKILLVSLLASIFVVCVAINARVNTTDSLSTSPRLEGNTSTPDMPRPTLEGPTRRAFA